MLFVRPTIMLELNLIACSEHNCYGWSEQNGYTLSGQIHNWQKETRELSEFIIRRVAKKLFKFKIYQTT